ncbi:NAD(P)H-binding protein [Nonomuraea sp. NPDC050536]|uniref:NAD(P)H-binding protein n=1 Tax=Nonomuraea sp. NPDC050536 TaxID=3364366 RepID=UPI0037C5BF7A
MTKNTMTLVTGGTGKTGRRVVEKLTAMDRPVRIGTRKGGVPFDWEDRSTWAPALAGTSAAYLAYYPDLAVPGAGEAIAAFSELAVSTGTRRLVLLSGRGEEEAQHAEELLARSGAEWTVVRCSWFNQNFTENYLLEPIQEGHLVLPAGDVGEPFVDADDIADVAVAALTQDGHAGEIYEMTGPRLLTFAQAAAEIGAAVGREIGYTQIPVEAYVEHVPAEYTDFLTYLFTTVLDGRNAHLGDGVQRALGREPRDFADFARESAAAGIWG